MTAAQRALLQIHLCVVLWAFTAILGRLILLPAGQLVAWRLIFVVAVLALLPRAWRGARTVPAALRWRYAGIGVLVALHWLAFYGSVKLANASVATICLAIAPVTIALLDPLLHGAPLRRGDLALGIVVIPGIALIAGGVPASMDAGLWVGVLSAVLAAAFMTLNKRWIGDRDALGVTAIEFAAGLVVLLVMLPWLPGAKAAGPMPGGWLAVPSPRDFALLLVLATACTVLPFALSLVALRHVSAFTAQLAVNLEPIYAIGIAAIFLGESRELGAAFYAGAGVVVAAVFLHARAIGPAVGAAGPPYPGS
ncbi:MAG: DMT family transporter [Steroidobacteraceae bacterium]|nr:DMT family transporter [Steroidobacteraceae bacterium]